MQFDFITEDLNENLKKSATQLRNLILQISDDLIESVYSSTDIKIATYSTKDDNIIVFGIQPDNGIIKFFIKDSDIASELDLEVSGSDNNTHIVINDDFSPDTPEFKSLIYKTIKN